jgi:hypothetical protein
LAVGDQFSQLEATVPGDFVHSGVFSTKSYEVFQWQQGDEKKMLGTQGGGVQHYFGDALCNEKVILEILFKSNAWE